ncbi:type VI secretion system baseplate subunit TssG [Serratia sp. T13T92]|uniref:type VI secretion system baseplate subunit TssG n=1 Tax=Serratia sp. T13T92 TaxID=3397496 RepID=UPI0039E0686E
MDLTRITSKFSFYQQIRVLLRKLRDGKTPMLEILDRKLSLASMLSLKNPNGQVANIVRQLPEERLKVTLWQNGLTGVQGALPTAYTEWMIARHYRYGDDSAKAFLDMFDHRLYCLDYLAWQKNHLYAQAEFDARPLVQQVTQACTGFLTAASERYTHLFSSPVRTVVNLESWLSHYFNVPVQIRPFTGKWLPVSQKERCYLGHFGQKLESAPIIGSVRWDIQSHFDVILGPMEQAAAQYFIPHGKYYHEIWQRIREYVGPVLDFSIYLEIKHSKAVPLGAGQLGFSASISQSDAMSVRQVCLPVCESLIGS